MRVSIEGLINRLDDLRERLNELFDKLDQEEVEIEDVEEYFQNDDTFNLSIALDVLEQADTLDKTLDIIKEKLIDMTRLYESFKRNDLSFYNYYCYEQLTQEEWEFLRKVLL